MNVAVIGANSQVGTELCFLFRAQDWSVRPVVRSKRGAWFLDHQNFDCHVADATYRDEIHPSLSGVDVVVVAAFAGQFNRHGFRPRDARRTNTAIVRNVVSAAPDSSTVVYLSSIHAFGKSVGPSRWSWYGIEKRNAEKQLLKAGRSRPGDVYPIRLGHVFGPNQGKTTKLIDPVANGSVKSVDVAPDRKSNIVHTVTIKDAIGTLHEGAHESRVYSVVNRPQWTWSDVYAQYLPQTVDVDFDPGEERDRRSVEDILRWGVDRFRRHELVIRSLLVYAPRSINLRLSQYLRRSSVGSDIDELRATRRFSAHEFEYEPTPGPFVTGLDKTETLLSEYDQFRTVFECEYAP